MSNAFLLFRSLVIYGICLPLAIFLGYLLATPMDLTTVVSVGIVLALLSIPLFLRWHYPWMLLFWNANAIIFFLPGKLQFSILLVLISFSISALQYILNRNLKFLYVQSIAWPLFLLATVVIFTAKLNGGIGLNVLGGENIGGKRYVYLLIGVLGFFAISSRKIPSEKAPLYIVLFFIGALSAAIGSLIQVVSPALYFIFLIFPPEEQGLQAVVSSMGPEHAYTRLGGLSGAGTGVLFLMLACYGLRGVFNLKKFWRPMIFMFFMVIGLFGGFRSMVIILGLVLGGLFYFEGFMRSRILPILILFLILGGTLTVSMVDKMPLSIQRSLSFLPIKIDPIAERDARASSDWRLQMWATVLPQVPKYLILGKGYSINASEMDQIQAGLSRGGDSAEGAAMAGDYHNGPLSLIMPFGILGAGAFIWFLVASLRVLYQNFKNGDPSLQKINTFLYIYFFVKAIAFFLIFGSLYSDMIMFAGIVGFSIALNGGVCKPVVEPVARPVLSKFRLAGAVKQS
ncbi:O-antigen ligase family protein [Pedosphaera parvula]|uniref:O-antigen ligase-related domain-containing protein n=1 Tax=Pedosphaera parvula (strain Ellin514) TaxID=320771 RepID=B9XSB8_PEDPL|nr:O-antigen ligase family protein [Pedosphaera parvula]EEF57251.1 hypothetical protein Cflav_PD0404 [Pedosphaera parvula Ellin514]